ncbi:MAG TPA: hypothetical protein VGN26_00380 [Armatimonadota bacterium]|jgi:hypothetical protein
MRELSIALSPDLLVGYLLLSLLLGALAGLLRTRGSQGWAARKSYPVRAGQAGFFALTWLLARYTFHLLPDLQWYLNGHPLPPPPDAYAAKTFAAVSVASAVWCLTEWFARGSEAIWNRLARRDGSHSCERV